MLSSATAEQVLIHKSSKWPLKYKIQKKMQNTLHLSKKKLLAEKNSPISIIHYTVYNLLPSRLQNYCPTFFYMLDPHP